MRTNIYTKGLLVLLLFLSSLLPTTLSAQNCTMSNLSQNIGNRVSGHTNTGQSFTANCAGNITAVTVVYNELPTAGSTDDRLLIIRDGNLCTSPILHQQIFTAASVTLGANTFVLTTPVPINMGEVNAWEITSAVQGTNGGYGVAHNSPGAYPGGNSWYSCSQLTGFDATFEVIIGATAPQVDLGPDSSLCAGDSITLDAGNAGNSFLWSTGDTSQTLLVTTTGTYSVVVTDGGGNTGTDSVVITVNPNPTVDLGPDQQACDGTSVTLDAGNPGAAYSWNNGDTLQTVTTMASGTFSVTVTDSNGCMGADTATVIIFPNPVVNLGPDQFLCGGDTACLDPGATAVSCIWSNGASSPTICVGTSGTYTVICTDANNCSGTDTVNITVAAPVVVDLGPDTDICSGDTLCLSAGSGGAVYTWNNGATTPDICVTVPGTYSVTCTDSAGCDGTDEIVVTVTNSPNAVITGCDTSNCPQVTFTDGSSNVTAWHWDFGDGDTSNTQNPVHTYMQNNLFTVSLTASNQCGSSTTTKTVDIKCIVGIEEGLASQVQVYPNPNQGSFQVNFQELQAQEVSLQIISVHGQVLFTRELSNLSDNHIEPIELNNFSQGIYYLRINADGQEMVHQIMIKE